MASEDSHKSPSRLGLTLQGYDQVIALSQDNINTTLQIHFNRNKDLAKFECESDIFGSFVGELRAPTIELVDRPGADSALYVMNFRDGTWTRSKIVTVNGKKEIQDVTKSMKNWALAFEVTLATTSVEEALIPGEILARLATPGLYNAQQLAIQFGVVQRSSFDMSKTLTPGLESQEQSDLRSQIHLLVQAYVQKQKDGGGVLGYALTAKDLAAAKAILPDAPSFPPTSVRPQIVANRPNGDEKQITTANSNNAFMWTEMTEHRELPDKELQWSGNWFYSSIGGTLAMSRRVFWDSYLMSKVSEQHLNAASKCDDVVRNMFGSAFAKQTTWNARSDSKESICRGIFKGTQPPSTQWNGMSWESSNTGSAYVELDRSQLESTILGEAGSFLGKTAKFFGAPEGTDKTIETAVGAVGNAILQQTGDIKLHTSAWSTKGSNQIVVRQEIAIDTTLVGSMIPCPADVGSFVMKTGCATVIETTLTLAAVQSGGALAVSASTKTTPSTPTTSLKTGGIVEHLPDSIKNYLNDQMNSSDNGQKLARILKEQTQSILDDLGSLGNRLGEALKNQGSFIFPGGGTFDIKDPVFSDAGDLLMGLSYVMKKGA